MFIGLEKCRTADDKKLREDRMNTDAEINFHPALKSFENDPITYQRTKKKGK